MTVLTQVRNETSVEASGLPALDMKLEVVALPVADIDRAKEFYGGLDWRLRPPSKSCYPAHGPST